MSTEFLTPGRVKPLGRLLVVAVVLGALLVLASLPLIFGSYLQYGVLVLVVGVVIGVSGGLAVSAVRARRDSARRLSILTGVLLTVLSVLLIPIWIGMLTVVAGIGILVVTFAREREDA